MVIPVSGRGATGTWLITIDLIYPVLARSDGLYSAFTGISVLFCPGLTVSCARAGT